MPTLRTRPRPFPKVEELAHLVFLALTLGEQRSISAPSRGNRLAGCTGMSFANWSKKFVARSSTWRSRQHGARRHRAEGRVCETLLAVLP